MGYTGELISLAVAFSWTATALFAEVGTKRIGSLQLNIIRMTLSLLMLGATLWIVTGAPWPRFADGQTWFWLLLSGLIGYVFGDWCLFNSYLVIGARFGQLFMTLAPPVAAITGWALLGETISLKGLLGMVVTLSGIAMSILSRGQGHKVAVKLPIKGVLLGIGAGVGQGVGLVLSKVGMGHYHSAIPEGATSVSTMVPFASTFIRAVMGAIGFILILLIRKEGPKLVHALNDRRGMLYASLATITGPFIGVSLSLMAVQYTNAGIASTIMALTPVLIIIPSYLIFKQKVKVIEVIGAIISIAGVSLFFI
ncbi:MAG TPA: DMT family transporter [Bacteroidales bacterium]|nr:DMT family transporter [Bacteroidales bacterium]